jgi:hypothetical protein
MDTLATVDLFGDARFAGIEQRKRSLDRLADGAFGGGIHLIARLPGGIDRGFELVGALCIGHGRTMRKAVVAVNRARIVVLLSRTRY